MSWFEYSQLVLGKVGFDRKLFRKELRKLLGFLSRPERVQLLRWCRFQKPFADGNAAAPPPKRVLSGVQCDQLLTAGGNLAKHFNDETIRNSSAKTQSGSAAFARYGRGHTHIAEYA
ncbi:hypothetical protein ACFPMF_07260 [Larkinella bovis]|uniref:Uncharacterized protein n=1 Tax=Larkinella bovis TaxID=683041 RepID=A0ABW0I9D7_9BACT